MGNYHILSGILKTDELTSVTRFVLILGFVSLRTLNKHVATCMV
jgi:hypothetical protein